MEHPHWVIITVLLGSMCLSSECSRMSGSETSEILSLCEGFDEETVRGCATQSSDPPLCVVLEGQWSEDTRDCASRAQCCTALNQQIEREQEYQPGAASCDFHKCSEGHDQTDDSCDTEAYIACIATAAQDVACISAGAMMAPSVKCFEELGCCAASNWLMTVMVSPEACDKGRIHCGSDKDEKATLVVVFSTRLSGISVADFEGSLGAFKQEVVKFFPGTTVQDVEILDIRVWDGNSTETRRELSAGVVVEYRLQGLTEEQSTGAVDTFTSRPDVFLDALHAHDGFAGVTDLSTDKIDISTSQPNQDLTQTSKASVTIQALRSRWAVAILTFTLHLLRYSN